MQAWISPNSRIFSAGEKQANTANHAKACFETGGIEHSHRDRHLWGKNTARQGFFPSTCCKLNVVSRCQSGQSRRRTVTAMND